MRKRFMLGLAVLALTAVFASPAAAITGNSEEDFVHDYVGLLVFYTDDEPMSEDHDPFSHRCSGSLISPTVIVTAGHCTEGVDFGRAYFLQAVGPNYSPDSFGGLGGDETTGYPYEQGHTFSVADNYGFDGFATYPDTHDAGVVVLDEPYNPPSGTFGILPTAGVVDALAAEAGSNGKKDVRFRTVGYGLLDQDPVRESGTTRAPDCRGLPHQQFRRRDRVQSEDHGQPLEWQGRIVQWRLGRSGPDRGDQRDRRVVSFGMNPQCKGQDYSYRLDRTPVLDWINDPNRADAG